MTGLAAEVRAAIDAAADPEAATALGRYFQVRPGGYGEGDVFAGVQLSRLRELVAPWRRVPFAAEDWLPLLTSPVHDDQRIVLVASKGGHTDHPDWYKNAIANPDVTLVVDGKSMPMRARTATADERAELWPRVVKTYKGYAGYQRNTDREIPLLVCEPRP